MTAPNLSTWDVVPPYRPGTADFNGAELEDDADYPPDPTEFPSAGLFNTQSLHAVAYGKVVPNAIFSVNGSATPTLAYYTGCPSAPTAATFTVTRAAAGDVSITWPAGTFPPPIAQPMVSLNVPLVATASYAVSAINITNGVRVTASENAALADLSFSVQVY